MLSDHDKMMLGIGAAKRLHVPLGDRFLWREYADLLRGLCTDLDWFSRAEESPTMTEYDMHLRIISKIDGINRIARESAKQAGVVIKDGRPISGEQRDDGGGTTSRDGRWQPQVLDYQRK